MYKLKLSTSIEDKESWNSFVNNNKENQIVTIAHNPSLTRILSETFGYKSACYFIMEYEDIIGVLPGVYFRNKFVSMPHFSYGGPIYREKIIDKPHINELLDYQDYDIRSFDILSEHYNDEKIICYLNLESSIDKQWTGFKSKLRSQIKNGQKKSLEIFHGGNELLSDFYKVYTHNMLRLGSPPLPKIFFENIFKYYSFGDVNITLVKKDNLAVAAGMTLSYMKFNEVCWASSNHKFNKLNVNMVLYWEMIKYSISKENTFFSFGRSSKESRTLKFKLQWGAVVKPLFFNYSNKRLISLKKNTFLPKLWRIQPTKTSIFFGKIISKYIY